MRVAFTNRPNLTVATGSTHPKKILLIAVMKPMKCLRWAPHLRLNVFEGAKIQGPEKKNCASKPRQSISLFRKMNDKFFFSVIFFPIAYKVLRFWWRHNQKYKDIPQKLAQTYDEALVFKTKQIDSSDSFTSSYASRQALQSLTSKRWYLLTLFMYLYVTSDFFLGVTCQK